MSRDREDETRRREGAKSSHEEKTRLILRGVSSRLRVFAFRSSNHAAAGAGWGLGTGAAIAMRAEISYDLVMCDDMDFVEGTYRLPGKDWQVFIFGADGTASRPEINPNARWRSGVTGVHVRWPRGLVLNRAVVTSVLSEPLGVTEWVEVRGPDSIQLR